MRLDHADTYARAAASDLFTLGLDALTRWLRERVRTDGDIEVGYADEERRAAALLGVAVVASADEIRAALRSKIVEGNLHPDQRGDGVQACELIAAQNLLLARARDRRGGGSDHG